MSVRIADSGGFVLSRALSAAGWVASAVKPQVMLTFLLICAALVPRVADAQSAGDWVGKRVVPKTADFGLRIGRHEKAPLEPGQTPGIYSVVEQDGPWILLQPDRHRACGWVQAERVVATEEAVQFFTNRIRANPLDAFSFAMRGMVHDEQHAHEEALRDFDQAVKLKPAWALAYKLRGEAWRFRRIRQGPRRL